LKKIRQRPQRGAQPRFLDDTGGTKNKAREAVLRGIDDWGVAQESSELSRLASDKAVQNGFLGSARRKAIANDPYFEWYFSGAE